jgi:hypothetical protein
MKNRVNDTISINDFISFLRENDLLIVNRNEFLKSKDRELELARKRILKQPFITISEIVSNKLLNKSKSTLLKWIKIGVIKDYEYKRLHDKRKTIALTNRCVERLIDMENKKLN